MKINWKNLKKLYAVTKEANKIFDMRFFRATGKTLDKLKHIDIREKSDPECGTACCLLGHGPLSPELKPDASCFVNQWQGNRKVLDWDNYSEKTFGIEYCSRDWDFLFSSEWAEHPETATKEQALARLAYFIRNRCVPRAFEAETEDFNKVYKEG